MQEAEEEVVMDAVEEAAEGSGWQAANSCGIHLPQPSTPTANRLASPAVRTPGPGSVTRHGCCCVAASNAFNSAGSGILSEAAHCHTAPPTTSTCCADGTWTPTACVAGKGWRSSPRVHGTTLFLALRVC